MPCIYSFKVRANSCAPGSQTGLSCDYWFINKLMVAFKTEVWAVVTSKGKHDQAKPPFLLLDQEED